MPDQQSPSSILSQNVETQVRTLIGELQMQVIVLRNMLEMAQKEQQQQPRPPGPQPIPPQPEQPEPEKPPGTARGNGRGPREVIT